ncbi:MAG TPA: hypothetical protein VEV84_05830 [Pyrinomonadaceae bacterium]|nr:hypothetical protein [Pyrinomonadaceae bacterium]
MNRSIQALPFIFAILILLFFGSIASGQGTVKRVEFPKGRTTMVLKGVISDRAPIDYLVRAKAGQKMTLHLISSPNLVDFDFYLPNGKRIMNSATGLVDTATDRVYQLQETGDYRIRLIKSQIQIRHTSARYTFEINIR